MSSKRKCKNQIDLQDIPEDDPCRRLLTLISSFTHLTFDDAVGMGLIAILKGVSSRFNTLFGCRK
jgi:hypothetical protein